ncbi:GH39 family glycosyl hydrolase [Trichococcus shcherbakoviae]|uniref:Helix-turn-helix domain-containing protein n=1 Tax=Trichococcus shcherbakoviae subsp. psychrophilus TaxID=2585775 RepID=A0A5C5E645_9LACT|nr:helix-turn-helix domain-containing protein [Trichococcus shcherbakoviae]TNV67792.1 helix-turn-helix domain-containing protein [Trichococcus shcherbakoviae subsp. psychrophilus]
MKLINPWENIKIKKIGNKEVIQNFDDDIHLLYVLVGELSVESEGSYLTLQKDDFFILHKSKSYTCHTGDSKVFQLSLQYFYSEEDESDPYSYYFTGDSVKNTHSSDMQVTYLLNQLVELYIFKEQKRISEIFEVYFNLINTLEKKYFVKVQLESDRSIKQKVEEVKFYIDNNFDKEIRLSDLAGKLFVSEQYLSKLFSNEIGLSLSEYLIRKRLEKVRKDLFETEKSVTNIAFSAGFSNINSFNRLFKKYQGLTPSEYRRESKKGIEIQSSPFAIPNEELTDLQKYFVEEEEGNSADKLKIDISESEDFDYDKYLINLGYAGDLLHTSFAQQIRYTQEQNAFRYGRIWGLFNNVLFEQVGDEFDFTKVDEILQTVLDAGMIPFLELGFKGKLIHETHTKIIKKEPFELKTNRMDGILLRFTTFLNHCIDKYGDEEVSKWIIEIWKPNALVLKNTDQEQLSLIEMGDGQVDISQYPHYIRYFSKISESIKRIVPGMQVGGCGLSLDIERGDMRNFLRKWKQEKVKPDFISIGIYPIDEIKHGYVVEKRANPISHDEDYMLNKIKEIRTLLDELDLGTKLYVTEFNVTILNREIVNDTAFKGAYILKNILSILSYCDLIGYWQLSDLTVTSFDTAKKEIFGGAGILSKNGVPKIGYYAFKFLKKLGPKRIFASENLIVTRKEKQYQLLCYHYSHLNATYYYDTIGGFHKNNAYAIFDNEQPIDWTIELNGFEAAGKYRITKYSIGKNNGNFLEEVNAISQIDHFDKEMIQYLKQKCVPKIEILTQIISDDKLVLEIHLSPYDICLFDIQKVSD